MPECSQRQSTNQSTTLRSFVDGETRLWLALRIFVHTNDVLPTSIPFNGTQGRDSSKFFLACSGSGFGNGDWWPPQWTGTYDSPWKDREDSMKFLTGRPSHYHNMNDYALRTRSSLLCRFSSDHISDKNGRRGNVPPYARAPIAIPKSQSLFAMTVMDKVEGWNDEEVVRLKFAASMWIYTKAVLCDGRVRGPPLDLRQMHSIIMESVSWVTENCLWEQCGSRSPMFYFKKTSSWKRCIMILCVLPTPVGTSVVLRFVKLQP